VKILFRLIPNLLQNLGWAVTAIQASNAAGKIEKAISVDIFNDGALCFFNKNRKYYAQRAWYTFRSTRE